MNGCITGPNITGSVCIFTVLIAAFVVYIVGIIVLSNSELCGHSACASSKNLEHDGCACGRAYSLV